MNHLVFFPRGEVGKLTFLSNSQIGPYSLMPIATSPISDVASLTAIPSATCCSSMLHVLKGSELKTFLHSTLYQWNMPHLELRCTPKRQIPSQEPNGSVFQKGFASF